MYQQREWLHVWEADKTRKQASLKSPGGIEFDRFQLVTQKNRTENLSATTALCIAVHVHPKRLGAPTASPTASPSLRSVLPPKLNRTLDHHVDRCCGVCSAPSDAVFCNRIRCFPAWWWCVEACGRQLERACSHGGSFDLGALGGSRASSEFYCKWLFLFT